MRFDFSFQKKKIKKWPNGDKNYQMGSLSFYNFPAFLKAGLRQKDANKTHRKYAAALSGCSFIYALLCCHPPQKKKKRVIRCFKAFISKSFLRLSRSFFEFCIGVRNSTYLFVKNLQIKDLRCNLLVNKHMLPQVKGYLMIDHPLEGKWKK